MTCSSTSTLGPSAQGAAARLQLDRHVRGGGLGMMRSRNLPLLETLWLNDNPLLAGRGMQRHLRRAARPRLKELCANGVRLQRASRPRRGCSPSARAGAMPKLKRLNLINNEIDDAACRRGRARSNRRGEASGPAAAVSTSGATRALIDEQRWPVACPRQA